MSPQQQRQMYQQQQEGYFDQPEDQDMQDERPRKKGRVKRRKRGGILKTVLQFVAGLLVIAGVAAAIVMLYLKYYQ
jgi:cytoskeletal protein RodZ